MCVYNADSARMLSYPTQRYYRELELAFLFFEEILVF